MSSARHRRQLTRGWFRRMERKPARRTTRLATLAAVLVVGGGTAVAVPALTATPASADTATQDFTTAGTYTVTVPQYVTSFSVTGLGGAGLPGQPASDNVSAGGTGGSGSYISETFSPIPSDIRPGDILKFEVGAGGGGGAGGSGDGIAGVGGAGGGYTHVSDETTGETLLIAAGGGGGGGGSGLFADYVGGNGGIDGGGSSGLGQYGQATGAGGAEGPYCPDSVPALTEGSPGQSAPSASADGGGGGGGGGGCGGSGGQASLGGGGGGGGSGYSVLDSEATSKALSSGSNTGDGSASVTFTTAPPANEAPTFTSPDCQYLSEFTTGNFIDVAANGVPAPTFSLVDAPSWLELVDPYTATNSDGTFNTNEGIIATVNEPEGQYTFPVEASNSVGSVIEPVTFVDVPNISEPTFLSSASATATAGQPFTFQAQAVGCPPIATYSISQNSSDVPWLSVNSDGVLSGTPTASDVGTHTFTLSASPEGVAGTPITQTFTLTVNGPAATAPDAPAIGPATAGNGQATVAFTPPASDGGSPITGYTVTATDTTNPANGGQTFTGTGSPVTITGLTNGDSYTFTVTATNAAGTGPASASSNAVTPAAPVTTTAPGAPVIGTAAPGNAQATVTFSPPASNGGSPITGYTVTATDTTDASNGGQTATGTGSPVTITGLTNGDSYTFTVTATNAVGTGPASAASNAVTPTAPVTTTAPGAPVIGTATPGNAQATVTFTPPASNGGSPITGYTVTATDTTNHAHGGQTATGTGSPVAVTGLTNGDRYTFTVKATNAVGTGPASAPSKAVTPQAPVVAKVPGAPVIDAATPGNGQARVIFQAPASNGGSPITGYTVTAADLTHPSHGGQTATGKSSPITVTHLTNGDRYTFTVTATNAVGTGPASGPSKAVTPATVPGAPSVEDVTAGDGEAQVIFGGPASDGGSPVTRYEVTASDLSDPRYGNRTATGGVSPITVTHLINGDRYTFTVKAANAVGLGPASAPSKAVTPEAPKPRADLTTALSRHPSAQDGSTFTETVTVTNHGPSAAPDVVTKVILPGHLSVVSAHGGRQAGAVISWTAPSLSVGKSVSYSVTVKVAARAQGPVLIAATIISAAVDPNPLNNWAITVVKLG